MRNGVFAILKNGMYVSALRHLLKDLNIAEFPKIATIEDCLNGGVSPKILITQKECIPSPSGYSMERLRQKNPECHVVMLNADELEPEALIYCHTQIFSTESEQVISDKLKSVFQNKSKKDLDENTDASLSDREVEVVQLVAIGKTNKEISEQLIISTHTVITHRKNITSKLGIKTIAGLVVYAVLNGLIDPEEVNS